MGNKPAKTIKFKPIHYTAVTVPNVQPMTVTTRRRLHAQWLAAKTGESFVEYMKSEGY